MAIFSTPEIKDEIGETKREEHNKKSKKYVHILESHIFKKMLVYWHLCHLALHLMIDPVRIECSWFLFYFVVRHKTMRK